MLKKNPETVSDLMTAKVVTITEDESLELAEKGMKLFHFRHLPVVKDGKLAGLVTHSDLLHASSSWLSEAADERDKIIFKLPVSKIMQREVLTVLPDDSIYDAAHLMWEAKLGCLPVCDDDGVLLGILTEGDFVKLAVRMFGKDTGPPPAPSSIPH